MPQIRDIAAQLVHAGWNTPASLFERVWAALDEVPLDTIRLDNRATRTALHPALAAAGGIPQPVMIAVMILKQSANESPGELTLAELQEAFRLIGTRLLQPGMAQRLVILSDSVLQTTETATSAKLAPASDQPVTMIYTHDQPEGFTATDDQPKEWLRKVNIVVVFIYHRRGLGELAIGRIYCNGRPLHGSADPRISPLEYRILRYLLKKREHEDERHLDDIVHHCWLDPIRADHLRHLRKHDTTAFADNTSKERSALTKLNNKLALVLGSRVRSFRNYRWVLDPWPQSYVVIEER